MEHAPGQEVIEEPPLNLVDLYSDTQITVTGITGTIGDLISMCDPKNLTDPIANNLFTIKALNEAGAPIDKAHASLFSEVLEKEGIKPKFTIASSAEKPTIAKPDKTVSQSVERVETVKTAPKKVREELIPYKPTLNSTHQLKAAQSVHASKSESQTLQEADVLARAAAQIAVAEAFDIKASLQARRMDELSWQNVEQTGHAVAIDTVAQAVMSPEAQQHETLAQDVPRVVGNVLEPAVNAENVETVDIDSQSIETGELTYPESSNEPDADAPMYAMEDTNGLFTEPVLITAEATETINIDRVIDVLATELSKDPLRLLDDFVAAGEYYMHAVSEDQILRKPAEADNEEQQTPSPLVIVIERMQSVDESMKIQAAETVQLLIGAVHGLAVLESRTDRPAELTEQIAAQIVAICETLLTQLDLELSEDDMQSLAYLFQQPEFLAGFIVQEAEDAIDTGMHEALDDNSASISSYLSGIHPSRLLSRFILTLPVAA